MNASENRPRISNFCGMLFVTLQSIRVFHFITKARPHLDQEH